MDFCLQPKISSATAVLSECEKFLSTYQPHQPWSIPDSIIYYITKNPSTSKVYQKLIQSCKYFFVQNPLLVVSYLHVEYKKNQWNTFLDGKNVDLNFVSSKLWIIDTLCIENDTPIPPNSLPIVLSKISDVKEFTLEYQKIYIADFQFLVSKCEKLVLNEITVINEDNSVVGLEEIVGMCPKIKSFVYTFPRNFNGQNVMTSETVQKLSQIPHFSNLSYCNLREIPEIFDLDNFYDFIKKNKKTTISLHFAVHLSQEYRNRLQTIVDEILSTQNHDYKVPFILFSGDDFSSLNTLWKLHLRN